METKNKKYILPLLVCFLAVNIAQAQHGYENQWRLSVGTSYRGFDEVEFESTNFGNSGNVTPANGPLGIQGFTDATFAGILPPFTAFNTDHAVYNGSDSAIDPEDRWAPVVGLERHLHYLCGWNYNLVINLQYYNVDMSAASTNFTAVNYTHLALPAPGGIIPAPTGGPFNGFQAGTTAIADNEFKMDLLVLDLGIKASRQIINEKMHCSIAGGPSLNFADFKTSRTLSATWTSDPAIPGDTGEASYTEDDDDTNLRVGAYLSMGVQYDLTDRWSVGAEGRYDKLFGGNPGTDLAEIDLDGFSGQLKVFYRF